MSRTRNARALRMIGLAALAGLHPIYNTTDDKGGGGGADDKTATDDKGKKGKKEAEKKEPEKVELTADELERKIADAKASAKADFDAEREKEKKTREEEDARKKGEFEKLYQAETGRVKELERDLATSKLEARKKDVAIRLNRHLAADHKDYIENDVDILPHVAFDADTKDDEIDKRIKAATDAFVKRTPKASALSGVAGGANRGKLPAGTDIPEKDQNDQRRATRPVGPAARF